MTIFSRRHSSLFSIFARRPELHTIALLACILIAGCSSTREIETSPPQTIDSADGESQPPTRQARLAVVMGQGETSLPEDIERFEFRISEVRLHRKDGDWVRLPSDEHQFALPLHRNARRTVLDAQVAPAGYDSVAISFDHLFARFSENAGAPLTAAEGEPLRLALDLETSLEAQSVMTLQFEPGASLRRAPDCRWFFIPVVRAGVE